MLLWIWKKGNSHSLLLRLQIIAASMGINMKNFQKGKSFPTIQSSDTTVWQVPKGVFNLHHRYLLSHIPSTLF